MEEKVLMEKEIGNTRIALIRVSKNKYVVTITTEGSMGRDWLLSKDMNLNLALARFEQDVTNYSLQKSRN